MNALQRNQEQIANNLANANTTGHKRSRVMSKDLLYQNVQADGEGEASGGEPAELKMGHGATSVATMHNFSQGSFAETGNALNMAINGDGFFQVRRPGGDLACTRDGTFALSSEGNIFTQTGLQVQPNINVPLDAVEVDINKEDAVSARL